MNQNDPTDSALAAIASILDHKEPHEFKNHSFEHAHVAEHEHVAESEHAVPAVLTESVVTETVVTETIVTEIVRAEVDTIIAEHDSPTTVPDAIDVDGYFRAGPGPLDAIRFRWTARRDDDGRYFVDETIGNHSRPVSTGPMPRDEVVQFIDDRERAAHQRFNELKRDMTLNHRADTLTYARADY